MKKIILLACLLASPAALAGDAAAGEEKAQPCIACHGESGNKPIANYPIIGGQPEGYLLYALKAYKNGARPNAVMAAQMAALSAEDIADLAAYYAAQDSDLR